MNTYRYAAIILHFLSKIIQVPLLKFRKNKVYFNSHIGIGSGLYCTEVGKYTYIASNVYINNAKIGNYCSIASGTKIGGSEHSWWWGSTSARIRPSSPDKQTTIGHDVWIGSNAVIRQGVSIGHGAVIGAGSVVLTNVQPFTIVAGIPAKVLKTRFPVITISQIIATKFWERKPDEAFKALSVISYPRSTTDHE